MLALQEYLYINKLPVIKSDTKELKEVYLYSSESSGFQKKLKLPPGTVANIAFLIINFWILQLAQFEPKVQKLTWTFL